MKIFLIQFFNKKTENTNINYLLKISGIFKRTSIFLIGIFVSLI